MKHYLGQGPGVEYQHLNWRGDTVIMINNSAMIIISMLFENRSKDVSHWLSLLKTWTKSFENEKVKAVGGGCVADEHQNAITVSGRERWENVYLTRN